MRQTPLAELRYSSFSGNCGSRFKVRLALPTEIHLELVRVDLLGSTDAQQSAGAEAFSLLFRGPLANPLPQATYLLEHEVLGSFPIFIVPVERDKSGMLYEAIFNRPSGSSGGFPGAQQ